MGLKIRINNPSLVNEEKSYLTRDYSDGASIVIRDNEGFTVDWYAIVGEPGQEQTEAQVINALSGNETLTLDAALKFAHAVGTPVYLSRWARIVVERALVGSSSYSVVTNSETGYAFWDIEWDDSDMSTLVVDDSGGAGYNYRWRFHNPNTGTYSSYSPVLPGAGLGRDTAGYCLQEVYKNPVARGVDAETIFGYFNDFQDMVYERMPKAWWFQREGSQISTVASTYKYSISANWSDLGAVKYMMYRYINGSNDRSYPLTFRTELEFRNFKADSTRRDSDNVTAWTLYPPDESSPKGYIALEPTPETTACYLYPVYYIALDDISNFADTLVVPRPKGYVDYALYRIFDDIKQDEANASKFYSRVEGTMDALKQRSKRQLGQREHTRFRGQQGYQDLYGNNYQSPDYYRENFF